MNIKESDLGNNALILLEKVKTRKNSTFVDLGVRHGVSSFTLLTDSEKNDNYVYGVDLVNSVSPEVIQHPRYSLILNDSVTAGKEWDSNKKVDILFVDTLHIREQVLCELYYWYPKLSNNALIVFHDTNWPNEKKDYYKGQYWERPEEAIKIFFELTDLNFEDKYIKVEHYPDSWGMTFVQLKNKRKKYGKNVNWDEFLKFHEN